MLHDFLLKNEEEILTMTATKFLEVTGIRPSSDQLKLGLPVFLKQLMDTLHLEQIDNSRPSDKKGMVKAANENDEEGIAMADGRPDEAEVAKIAGRHGAELLRLGYTLTHVVHAYGAMCQSITALATTKSASITPNEFHHMNRCLDIAIAGAVTGFASHRDIQEKSREVEHLGFLAHELRNALYSAKISLQLMKTGTVGYGGSTSQVLDRSLNRMEEIIGRSLTEVRLRIDPDIQAEEINLLQLVNQIAVTAEADAKSKNQILDIQISPNVVFAADQQLFYSAMSNVIQNALKYTPVGGKIQVRGVEAGPNIVVEVEDECGGLSDKAKDLFKPFKQQNDDRSGLGLGLTIAQRAIMLNHGTVDVQNLPGKGCIFKITLPKNIKSK